MTAAVATKTSLVCVVNVIKTKGQKKGKSDYMSEIVVCLGDMPVATRTIVGKCTERYALAQFRRHGHLPIWQKNQEGWDMYQSFKHAL